MTQIKDLGLIAGIIKSATPISNKDILWRDTTSNLIRYYDPVSVAWLPLAPTYLATVASSGDYNDLINKPSLFSGDYNDLTNKPVPLGLDSVLGNGNTTGGSSIVMTDGDVISAESGNSFMNLQEDGVDSNVRIHGHEHVYITTNFRKKIIIGANLHPTVDNKPVFVANPTYQQVQINGLNIRGNFSIGNGISHATPIIGIGTDYSQLRWGNLFITPNHASKRQLFQSMNGRFTFDNGSSKTMMSIAGIRNIGMTIPSFGVTTGVNNSETLYNGSIRLESNYWTKAVGSALGVGVSRRVIISTERYSNNGGVDYLSNAFIDYGDKRSIKLFENGDVELYQDLITKTSGGVRVLWKTIDIGGGNFSLEGSQI